MCLMRMVLIVALEFALASGTGSAQNKFFTVRDSIAMSVFIDPETRLGDVSDTQVELSPDLRHFAVVTSKGLIESNEIESTLWMFDSDFAKAALYPDHSSKAALPRVVARLAAVTNDRTLISDVRWSDDSRSILFLGQDASHGRRLYQAEVTGGAMHLVTPPEVSVSQYEEVSSAVVYAAASRHEDLENALQRNSINVNARSVLGIPLRAILFPSLWQQSDDWKAHELWAMRKDVNTKIIDPESQQPVKLISDSGYGNVLSLSPNGDSVVVLRQMTRWHPEWDAYEPENSHARFRATSSKVNFFAEWWYFPAEFAVVNLDTGKTISLLNAPLAIVDGYGQPIKAVWSPNGKKVLVTSTYLPLHGVGLDERSRRRRPCAAAVVEVDSLSVTCVRPMSRTADASASFVGDVSFGRSDEEVILSVTDSQNKYQPPERYQQRGGKWTRGARAADSQGATSSRIMQGRNNAGSDSFSVVVHQELNEPPALFVVDHDTTQRVKIWDPNPQLSVMNLGEATVLRWKDGNGHQWVAGLLKPPTYAPGKKYPLVIQTHGFEEHAFLADGGYTSAFAARPLASSGFIVLQMPYNSEHLVSAQELPDQILGFESAIDLLTSEELIDPARVGIIGFSRTGYHVEGALIKDPARFAAATIADGNDESYLQYLENSVDGTDRTPEEEVIHGTKPFGTGLKAWTKEAPDFNLDKIRAPLLLEATSGIASVLGEWEIYASLRLQGKPVDLISYPDGEHVLRKPLERLASQQGNVDWFRFWLKGEEDPDPAKAAQYARWRELHRLQEQNGKKSANAAHQSLTSGADQ